MFVEASEKTMCTVAYIRNEAQDGSIDVHFVSAKCKVAPLIATSIPRLELSAAVTGLRLARTITKALKFNLVVSGSHIILLNSLYFFITLNQHMHRVESRDFGITIFLTVWLQL